MKVSELNFTAFYHGYITIEADDLTEQLKDVIEVNEDDCYALCSSYCAEDGLLMFNVLSIGNSWETCLRGMDRSEMLGFFSMEQVYNREARIVQETMDMVRKNAAWIEQAEQCVDEDVAELRRDERLDGIRDSFYPDTVLVGVMRDGYIQELPMHIMGIHGPFVVGEVDDEPEEDIGLHFADKVWAIPYYADEMYHLIALFGGESLSAEEKEVLEKIITETQKLGIDFTGLSMKS